MSLFDTIKSLLGLGDTDQTRTEQTETTVSVEREPADESTADTETEAAVKGDEPVAADTDAAASTGSLVDEDEATDEPAGRAEPAEAAGPESDDETTDVDSVEVDAGEAEPTAEPGGSSEPVDVVKGIGPAYAERLADVGIETVGELAAADAADVAERITVSEKRVSRWIQRANER
jgi:predicted flap endonuclease-1-like 5' DNA nuclease